MALHRSALRDQPVLHTARLELRQLGPEYIEDSMNSLGDPEGNRMTGTQTTFTREQVLEFLTGLPGRDDRADFAIIGQEDGRFYGEVVLNGLDEDNASMNYRIAMVPGDGSTGGRGRGLGTEAGKAVVDWGFDAVGLHRIGLDVFDFNPRGLRSYEKIGFTVEGRQRHTLLWDGTWSDSILMGMLHDDPRPDR
ncbi:GNAT family N-acetyltransferase [Nakamurella sp. YIM 132087]|uniref:GNAT family N-acetyltransferase n=1 Tax=Nakamurella alba TaxID=2665158 RepID=A0A7K1FQT0_9ACTN|nr:GNAT family protein [Nakamurella alba]MTD16496.1 GNAT family N-acetyltransferase [Nakamurella alba]